MITENEIKEYLQTKRMSTVDNLAGHFTCSPDDILKAIHILKEKQLVRTAASKCAGSCSTCDECGPGAKQPESGTTIVISTELREET